LLQRLNVVETKKKTKVKSTEKNTIKNNQKRLKKAKYITLSQVSSRLTDMEYWSVTKKQKYR